MMQISNPYPRLFFKMVFLVHAILAGTSLGEDKSISLDQLESSVNFGVNTELRDNEFLLANNYFRTDLGFSLVLPITQLCERSEEFNAGSPVINIHCPNGGHLRLYISDPSKVTYTQASQELMKRMFAELPDLRKTRQEYIDDNTTKIKWELSEAVSDGALVQYYAHQHGDRIFVFEALAGDAFDLFANIGVLASFRFEDTKTPALLFKASEFDAAAEGMLPDRMVRCLVRDDKQIGLTVERTTSGKLVSRGCWWDGVPFGQEVFYWPNGKIWRIRCHSNGVPEGYQVMFKDDGAIHSMMRFQEGVANGEHMTFFRNGNISVKSKNVNGYAEGERFHYLPSGELRGVENYRNGERVSRTVLIEPSFSDFKVIESNGIDFMAPLAQGQRWPAAHHPGSTRWKRD